MLREDIGQGAFEHLIEKPFVVEPPQPWPAEGQAVKRKASPRTWHEIVQPVILPLPC